MGDVKPGHPADMCNRDPNQLNQSLMLAFEDVIGEPDSAHSIDCAWKAGHFCYVGGLKICYIILTVLTTWASGLSWGCTFACLTCSHVWCFTPCMKLVGIFSNCFSKFMGAFCDCVVAPACSAYGMMLSNIKITQVQG